ncbi:MAG: arylamine N-acetyltransferase, partial [Ilumatobacter sp.]|nr:arylamine N-acetyltransferase [Ilumatobacter sp.]
DASAPPDWSAKYVFAATPQPLAAFEAMNHEQQHAPDSHFRQRPVCSLLTADGRLTVSGERLIETTVSGERRETALTPNERLRALRDRFGIELDRDLTGPV